MILELYECEHCGKLFDEPLTITYGGETGTVYLCPRCGEEILGVIVEMEVE